MNFYTFASRNNLAYNVVEGEGKVRRDRCQQSLPIPFQINLNIVTVLYLSLACWSPQTHVHLCAKSLRLAYVNYRPTLPLSLANKRRGCGIAAILNGLLRSHETLEMTFA